MTEAEEAEADVVDEADEVDAAEEGEAAGDGTENRSSPGACLHYDWKVHRPLCIIRKLIPILGPYGAWATTSISRLPSRASLETPTRVHMDVQPFQGTWKENVDCRSSTTFPSGSICGISRKLSHFQGQIPFHVSPRVTLHMRSWSWRKVCRHMGPIEAAVWPCVSDSKHLPCH